MIDSPQKYLSLSMIGGNQFCLRPITHNCFLRKRNYLILSHVEQSTICFAFFHKDIVVNMFDSIEELNLRASAAEFFCQKTCHTSFCHV